MPRRRRFPKTKPPLPLAGSRRRSKTRTRTRSRAVTVRKVRERDEALKPFRVADLVLLLHHGERPMDDDTRIPLTQVMSVLRALTDDEPRGGYSELYRAVLDGK